MVPSTVPALLPEGTPRRTTRVIGYLHSSRSRLALREQYGASLGELRSLPRPSGPDGVCRNPLIAWDAQKSCPVLWRCGAHRASQCAPCAATYKRRVRRIVQTGVLDRLAAGGFLAMVTFTAPGETPGHLRWSVDGPRGHRPVCGCEAHAADGIGVWNRDAGARWNHLRTSIRRAHPGAEFYRAAEAQRRGALHHHVILWTREPLDRHALQRMALAAGYGCTIDVAVVRGDDDARRFVSYATKYVTKSTDDRGDCPWEAVDTVTGELSASRATFRTWSQSRGFGCTMRAHLDAIRAGHARYMASLPTGEELVAELLGGMVLEDELTGVP